MSSSMLRAARRRRRLVVEKYLAAGVGVAALASSAEASIVTISITSPNISGVNGGLAPGGRATFDNWPVAGGGRLEIYNDYQDGNDYYSGLDGDSLNSSANQLQFAVNSTSAMANPTNFAAGSLISGSSTFSSSSDETVFRYDQNRGTVSNVNNVSPAFGPNSYMGFRFSSNSGTDWNYGWVKVTWDGVSQWQVLGAAYETTLNTPIAAGATGGAVPEPGSGAMVALLMGGTALNQWRKNRRESAEGASEENAELAS